MRNIPVSWNEPSLLIREASAEKQIKIRRLLRKYKIKVKEI
jgi:hypothetical protein